MNDLLKGSAFGFLQQACAELCDGKSFDSEEAFKHWIAENMQSIIQRASEINAGMLNKVASEEGEKVKKMIAIKVWESVNINAIRERAISEYNAILKD